MPDETESGQKAKLVTGNPFLDAWIDGQQRFFKGQFPEPTTSDAKADSFPMSDLFKRGHENWKLYEQQVGDWMKASGHWASGENPLAGNDNGVAQETMRRMLDPSRFMHAGLDEISQAIRKLVEGPEFADIGALERQFLKATKEWLALREASAAYSGVSTAAWSRAFDTFSKEMAAEPTKMAAGPRAVMDRWLTIANDELVATQRTDAFLDAQRRLLRAGIEYRIKQRELVEVWCETHSIPTRTEIDDLHRTVYELRRQVRRLTKEVDASKAPAKKRTKKKTPAKAAATGGDND